MQYDETILPVCIECELEHEAKTKMCLKCGIAYCPHYSSITDSRYCGNCLADFRVTETIEIKTTERTNEEGEVISRKRQMCKNLKLEGTDWLFESSRIQDMTDEQIMFAVEYHGAIKSLLVNEREDRKLERYKKLAGIQVKIRTAPATDNRTSGEKKSRSKTEKKPQDAATVAAALNVLGIAIDPAILAQAMMLLKEKK